MHLWDPIDLAEGSSLLGDPALRVIYLTATPDLVVCAFAFK